MVSKRRVSQNSARYTELLWSGLLCNENINWITFHSAYDFGFLVKTITQDVLPEDLDHFLFVTRGCFRKRIIDVKYMMKSCEDVYGSLVGFLELWA